MSYIISEIFKHKRQHERGLTAHIGSTPTFYNSICSVRLLYLQTPSPINLFKNLTDTGKHVTNLSFHSGSSERRKEHGYEVLIMPGKLSFFVFYFCRSISCGSDEFTMQCTINLSVDTLRLRSKSNSNKSQRKLKTLYKLKLYKASALVNK